jgi:DNA-binding response OmpR family regulator
MDTEARRVFLKGKETELTVKEFDLLQFFMENTGKVYSREHLLNTVWGFEFLGDVRTVDVHVRRIREKIEENPSDPKYIITKWGIGYYFN